MLFASRALANILYFSEGKNRKEILKVGLPKLLELLETEISNSSYEVFNHSNHFRSISGNLFVKPSEVTSSAKRGNIYYEIICMSIKGVHIGLSIPYVNRQLSKYLPLSMKVKSQFGKDILPFHFIFNLEKMTLTWMNVITPINGPKLVIGDVIGLHLDLIFYRIYIYINGILRSDGVAFDSQRHGSGELWACGFQPSIYFENEVISPIIFNFGQQEFEYHPFNSQ